MTQLTGEVAPDRSADDRRQIGASGGEALADGFEAVARGYALGPVTIELDERGKKRPTFHTSWQSDPAGVSRDPEQLVAWAREHPGCGFHAPCGPNGIVVVDQDVKRGPSGELVADGRRSWRAAGGPRSPMTVTTQSGGRQLYFRAPAEPIRNSAKALDGVPGVDVRGDGGTVFVSGSQVHGGGHYVADRIVPVAELPALPEAWAERLRAAGPSGPTRDRARARRERPTEPARRVIKASSVHGREWIEARVDDELRELRRGPGNFRARLFAASAIAYRAAGCGVLDRAEVEERLADAVRVVWGSEPDADDAKWIAEGRDEACADPWRLARDERAAVDPVAVERGEPDDDVGQDDSEDGPTPFDREVERELRTLRVRDEARRRQRAEGRVVARPDPVLLSELLAVEDEPARYRVHGLLPIGARAMLSAQAKAGKSTLRDNLVRSLVDGEAFLGHDVEPIDGRVVVLDAELDERMLRRWLRDQRIGAADRVAVVSLRGRVSSFDITDAAVRQEWADALREVDPAVVVLDCLRPVLDAIGLDEDKDAGRFLVAFDELLALAGAGEAVVVHHMGHGGERARGSTRLRDWPDVEWKLTRKDPEDSASARYFAAYGRDVDLGERELGYDATTRRLEIVGGSRRDAATDAAAQAIRELLGGDLPDAERSNRAITEALGAVHPRKAIRDGMGQLVRSGEARIVHGPRRSTLYYLTAARTTS